MQVRAWRFAGRLDGLIPSLSWPRSCLIFSMQASFLWSVNCPRMSGYPSPSVDPLVCLNVSLLFNISFFIREYLQIHFFVPSVALAVAKEKLQIIGWHVNSNNASSAPNAFDAAVKDTAYARLAVNPERFEKMKLTFKAWILMNQLHSEAMWQDCVFHFGQDWSWKLVNKNYTMKLLISVNIHV